MTEERAGLRKQLSHTEHAGSAEKKELICRKNKWRDFTLWSAGSSGAGVRKELSHTKAQSSVVKTLFWTGMKRGLTKTKGTE